MQIETDEHGSVTHGPTFSADELIQLQAFKDEMDAAYPHDDGSKWSNEATPVRVKYNGILTVGLIPDDDMVHIPITPYVFPLRG